MVTPFKLGFTSIKYKRRLLKSVIITSFKLGLTSIKYKELLPLSVMITSFESRLILIIYNKGRGQTKREIMKIPKIL